MLSRYYHRELWSNELSVRLRRIRQHVINWPKSTFTWLYLTYCMQRQRYGLCPSRAEIFPTPCNIQNFDKGSIRFWTLIFADYYYLNFGLRPYVPEAEHYLIPSLYLLTTLKHGAVFCTCKLYSILVMNFHKAQHWIKIIKNMLGTEPFFQTESDAAIVHSSPELNDR